MMHEEIKTRADAESEYALALSASEPLGLEARPTVPPPPRATWLAGDERFGRCAPPTLLRTTTEREPGTGLERVLDDGALNKL